MGSASSIAGEAYAAYGEGNGNMKVARAAAAFGVTASLVGGGLLLSPAASAANNDNSCGVQISGGTVSNNTGIGLSANGGTSIADASGGGNNVAVPGGLGSVASAGNGGVSNAAANGGAISMGDVNSGGNTGNAISVGNTNCAAAPAKPVPVKPEAPAKPGKAASVKALPATGVGEFGMDLSAALGSMAAAAAMVAGSLNIRRRR
jgi:hypothetical protein